MDLPAELLPTGQMLVTLSDDKTVALPVCSPTFSKWKGALPAFSFGNKQFLDYEGMPVFAEIVVLNILLKNGWQGVWVETYGGIHFLCSQPQGSKLNSITIPKEKKIYLRGFGEPRITKERGVSTYMRGKIIGLCFARPNCGEKIDSLPRRLDSLMVL